MKIKMNFGIVKTAILALVICACFVIIGIDIALLVGTETFAPSNPVVPSVSIAAATIIVIAAFLMLFNSEYRFENDCLKVRLCVFVDKIKYDEIDLVKQNSLTKDLYVIIAGEKVQGLNVLLKGDKVDKFLSALKEKRGDLIVEIYTPEKKNKK